MLLDIIKNESMIDNYKKAPRVGVPYVAIDDNSIYFHKNDPAMNQLVSGYSQGPENSYVDELRKEHAIFSE